MIIPHHRKEEDNTMPTPYRIFMNTYEQIRPDGNLKDISRIGTMAKKVIRAFGLLGDNIDKLQIASKYLKDPQEEYLEPFCFLIKNRLIFVNNINEGDIEKINAHMLEDQEGPFNNEDLKIIQEFTKILHKEMEDKLQSENLEVIQNDLTNIDLNKKRGRETWEEFINKKPKKFHTPL